MGKPRPKGKVKVSGKRLLSEYLTFARQSMSQFEYEEALVAYAKALEFEPQNATLMIEMAEALIEAGGIEEAGQLLHRSVELDPQGDPVKYLWLAQISQENEASYHFYEVGIEGLRKELDAKNEASFETVMSLRSTLSSALCAQAELFLKDPLCDVEDAPTLCQNKLYEAMDTFGGREGNVEALSVLADLRIRESKVPEAREVLHKCIRLIEEVQEKDGEKPSIEFQMSLSKIMIEVELYREAIGVLEGVLEEDDAIAEIHFLLGLANLKLNDNHDEEIQAEILSHMEEAKRLIEVGEGDELLLPEIEEILRENSVG